ncbi:MAG: hypothetical protein GY906_10385 [bacterium]|nr:hypothetical protein [bacterium]
MRTAVKLADMHQTLEQALPMIEDLTEQFHPNGGLTVADHITALTRGQEDIQDELSEVKNLVELHVTSRKRGGRRDGDPQ